MEPSTSADSSVAPPSLLQEIEDSWRLFSTDQLASFFSPERLLTSQESESYNASSQAPQEREAIHLSDWLNDGYAFLNKETKKIIAFNYGFSSLIPRATIQLELGAGKFFGCSVNHVSQTFCTIGWCDLQSFNALVEFSSEDWRQLSNASDAVAAGITTYHEQLLQNHGALLSMKVLAVQEQVVWIASGQSPTLPSLQATATSPQPQQRAHTQQPPTIANARPIRPRESRELKKAAEAFATTSPVKTLVRVLKKPRKRRPWTAALSEFLLTKPEESQATPPSKRRR